MREIGAGIRILNSIVGTGVPTARFGHYGNSASLRDSNALLSTVGAGAHDSPFFVAVSFGSSKAPTPTDLRAEKACNKKISSEQVRGIFLYKGYEKDIFCVLH